MFRVILRAVRSPLILHKCRLQHKLCTQKQKDNIVISSKVLHYLESIPEYEEIQGKIPESLLKKKKNSKSLYLINRSTAKIIANFIKNDMDENSPVIEINPGFCFLTEELLKYRTKIHLYESMKLFTDYLENMQKMHKDRVTYKIGELPNIRNKRTALIKFLGDLATDNNDRVVTIVGCMPSLSFLTYLTYPIIFKEHKNWLVKPELFVIMRNKNEFLTGRATFRLNKIWESPMLRLLFDFKVLTEVPKEHFLPWISNTKLKYEEKYYLVTIRRKEKLPCSTENLPLLQLFLSKCITYSTEDRVIPKLEEWIPDSGVWFATNQVPPDANRQLLPTEDDAKLPHMNIYTTFNELSLNQMVTIFKRLISWPQFDKYQEYWKHPEPSKLYYSKYKK